MSILEFARSFVKFKSDLSQSSVPDHRLLHFIQFWPEIKSRLGNKAYTTYVDEWLAIIPLVTKETIFDLSPDELEVLGDILSSLLSFAKREQITEELKGKLKLVQLNIIKKLFYLGKEEKALELSAQQAGIDHIPLYDKSLLENLDAYECLKALTDWFLHQNSNLGNFLKGILDEWQAERENETTDSAWCLFVDTNGPGGVLRGRLRKLKGLVEAIPSAGDETRKSDTVSFDNQVKSPDDPLIGVVYDSLKAVRGLISRSGFSKQLTRPYRSFYSIEDRQFSFTGDSIGLAAGLIAYTQLLSGEVLREKKRISSVVGFTGGIDINGNLLPINKDTLSCKIERAFHSSLKRTVLPEDCLPEAIACLQKFSASYPRRRLRLDGYKRLSEVKDSRDVLNHQRVSAGEFVVRKVYKHTRTAKVQIPLLLVLIYLGICLFYPKAWVGYDWNPANLKITETGFVVMNSKGQALWVKKNICPGLLEPLATHQWRIEDLDDDRQNEVLLLPGNVRSFYCKENAHLLVYDHNGDLLFDRPCAIRGEYPGDEYDSIRYNPEDITVLNLGSRKVIKTTVTASRPARAHHKFWSLNGDLLGWYVQAGQGGASGPFLGLDSKSRLLMLHMNNRLGCVGFYVLNPDSAYGVSPPYIDSIYDLSWVKHGNQICYISFPRSDISKVLGSLCDHPRLLELKGTIIEVGVRAGRGPDAYLSYFLDENFRVYEVSPDDKFIELWDSLSLEKALPNPNINEHLQELLESVAYWTDSGWVTEGQLRATGK